DMPVGVIRPTGGNSGADKAVAVDFVYADHLNTPRVITRANDGAIVWRWDSTEPFGVTQAAGTAGMPAYAFNLRFPGQGLGPATGLYYNGYRDYDPSLGRYVESDPVGLRGGINTYGYVRANPLSRVDLPGLADSINDGVAAAVMRGDVETLAR